jgi:hypothetical protein
MRIAEIDRAARGTPQLQVAVDGWWEHANTAPLPLTREIAARSGWTPSQALETLAGGPLGPPVRAELGAVNAWRSVEPLPLPIGADAAAIEAALADRTDLARCHRPVALEIVHQKPRQAWWAIEVSSHQAGMHQVRVERVAQLLRSGS